MEKSLKIKVCGMKSDPNMEALLNLSPDFMGMIFYPKSARFVPEDFVLPSNFHQKTKIVGVFVNEKIDDLLKIVKTHQLKYVQLHGDETPKYCSSIKIHGLKIIKVFSIGTEFDFDQLKEYDKCCDYFLFDTKGKLPGGNGTKFEWELLKGKNITKPFFLSGGINLKSTEAVINFANSVPSLIGIDINSGFEIAPGLKDINKISKFINQLKL